MKNIIALPFALMLGFGVSYFEAWTAFTVLNWHVPVAAAWLVTHQLSIWHLTWLNLALSANLRHFRFKSEEEREDGLQSAKQFFAYCASPALLLMMGWLAKLLA